MFDFKKASHAQEIIREKIKITPLNRKVSFIGGCDLTFLNPFKTPTTAIASIVVFSFPDLQIVEKRYSIGRVDIPYVPGFLGFREVPLLVKTFLNLKTKPDLLIVDGHGIAHPRRLGVASHLGVVLNLPTVGCAKKPLCGDFEVPENRKGAFSYIREKGEKIGIVLRTKENVKPVYVSPGHLVSFEDAKNYVLQTVTKYKLPEPTRVAHNYLTELRKKLL